MKIIDLSHSLEPSISLYNPAEKPEISQCSSHDKEGYAQKKLSLFSHSGTHIDAPYHIFKEGLSLDQMDAMSFGGQALVADVRLCTKEIKTEDLKRYSDRLELADFILLWTGWYKKWKSENYLKGFPVLSAEAAKWLLQFDLKGVGTDTISIDSFGSTQLPNHKIFLSRKMIIIENLNTLEEVAGASFLFSCMPLKYPDADGSPVRAVGFKDFH